MIQQTVRITHCNLELELDVEYEPAVIPDKWEDPPEPATATVTGIQILTAESVKIDITELMETLNELTYFDSLALASLTA